MRETKVKMLIFKEILIYMYARLKKVNQIEY